MFDHPKSEDQIEGETDPYGLFSDLSALYQSMGRKPSQALTMAMQFVLDRVGGKCVLLNRFDLENGLIHTEGGLGLPVNFRRSGHLAERMCYHEFVVEEKSCALYPNLIQSSNTIADPDILDHHFKAYLGAPIRIDGRVAGSLVVYDVQPRRFDSSQGHLIQILAQTISYILLQQTNEWNEKLSAFDPLDESQVIINQIFRYSPTPIYQIDLRIGRFTKVNEQACRVTGYSEEELLAMKAENLLSEESRQVFYDRLGALLAGDSFPTSAEFQVKTKTGDIHWGHFQFNHLYEDGVVWGAVVVVHIITELKKASEALVEHRRQLEALVEERTVELSQANIKLREEVRRRSETAKELQLKSERLKELNTAMSVLLDKRHEDRLRSEENIRVNLVQLIEPYIDRLGNSGLSGEQKQLLNVIRMNLIEVVGAPMPELSAKYYVFSPAELQVANLIRNGKTSKDIARILNISPRTVESYRNSIRKKLGLKNKKINLKTFLSVKE